MKKLIKTLLPLTTGLVVGVVVGRVDTVKMYRYFDEKGYKSIVTNNKSATLVVKDKDGIHCSKLFRD